ncbi:hypothetical protein ACFV1L_22000 [Kitasatospora sp. NPDC059646]|uniref:hypothetical protein n=1 Tax=Kitasatospora sp. NPDC059646 TaxID=3346893 RepID=UPI0036AA4A05
MSEINLAEDIGGAGGIVGAVLTYLRVKAQLLYLRGRMALLSNRVQAARQQMEEDAAEALVMVGLGGQAEVAPRYLGMVEEVAASLLGVAQAADRLASAADAASQAAEQTQYEHQAEYGGIHELAQQTSEPMAKPGWYAND